MSRIRVSGPARRDIVKILRRSGAEFGQQARDRDRRLIEQAIQDLGDDAARVGVQPIDDVREGYFIYHLKWSREASADSPVRQPRHVIAFYVGDSGEIIVARVFHERLMLSRHLVEPHDH